ncbi:MAG: ATP-binding cassette domain-containing protein [Actinobacteria bacterium]|nr:ATP-binding cassette domain-containing protein [Propionicimonas sp.]MBU3976945.1 ATP-binding cassette domain-containing protein [Actinomycetota bacterium]MBU3986690.1 ATP-binding cassette domain-containing protein [Actinomycetota bacterium]MBU4007158.1 ATP-binding cassette domain-containing protein [Actinomycetota bacterium]MBU4064911.1 ATP-binding cassette domain-containing protein [Actinomycetota bacterium]
MITFEQVSFGYPDAVRPVLDRASFEVAEGDLCLVIGPTGSGKSTLLGAINGLVPHFTGGTLAGRVLVDGRDTAHFRPRDLAEVVGYVGQDPMRGFVTDTVTEEVAYGMEQLGIDPVAMRKRVEETLDLLGIAELRNRALIELSGGQQQRVAIAAVLAARPEVLVLDEPTSALDPTAAADVLAAITTLVHEVGLTVVLAEHRLERVMHAADSMLWLPGDGQVVAGDPAEVLARANITPPLAALARTLGWERVPLSVREARRRALGEGLLPSPPPLAPREVGDPALVATGIEVRYGELVAVNKVDLRLHRGSVTTLLGRNGSGKSSLLWALQGALSRAGEVSVDGLDPRTLSPAQARRVVTLVPQTAADLLYLPTVGAECDLADRDSVVPPGTTAALLAQLGVLVEPERDPRDLSEGQQLSLVLAIQLSAAPPVLLLDEPTRGLDYQAKAELAAIISSLAADGMAVLVSTHDVEFAATIGERTLLMADGELIADADTASLLTSSIAYAPQMAKVFAPAAVLTPADVARWLA